MKHTTEPWTCGTVESNETRYTQPIWSNGGCVVVVYGGVNHGWTDEHRANARLIAAAPELKTELTASTNAIAAASYWINNHRGIEGAAVIMAMLSIQNKHNCAAIAKAEGGKQ